MTYPFRFPISGWSRLRLANPALMILSTILKRFRRAYRIGVERAEFNLKIQTKEGGSKNVEMSYSLLFFLLHILNFITSPNWFFKPLF